MKTLLTFTLLFILTCGLVSAYSLSDFPGGFAKSGSVTGIIVVGNQAPATHVIAQTQLALMLNGVAGAQQQGISKLDTEVSNLNQNIISLGNACGNTVSAQILGNPSPCHEGYTPGEASISIHRNGNYVHIVAAGYTDKGTKEAATVLQNYDAFSLTGETHTLTVDEPTTIVEPEKKEPEPVLIAEPAQELPQVEEKEDVQEEAPTLPPAEAIESEPEFIPVEENKPNVIVRLFSWFFGLFS